jgi:tetratricopeptide (TPR) repeat protein
MALNLTSDEDPRKADRYAALALEYSQKHAETKSLVDLETIIWHRQKALKLTLPGDPQYEIYLWRLVEELRMKYDATGRVSDLDMVLESRKHLIDLAPGVGFKRQINLKLLGTEYGYRYGKTKSLLDFEEAVRHYKSAIELNPNDILLVPGISEDLSAIFDKRYKESNEEEYLDVSITYGEMAVNSTPEGKIRKVWRLHDLGYKYYSKFSISHSLLDIEQAINYTRQALALAPETSHERRFRLFRSLGSCFEAKCLETHSVDDLLASIQYKECAFALGSHHRQGRQRLCKFIGGDFTTLYQMTMHLPYLETGIQKLNHFVNEVLVDNPMEILECLAKLAYAYEVRHRRTGEKADLDTLIQQCRRTLDAIPCGDPSRLNHLASLASRYQYWYFQTGALSTINFAIQLLDESISICPQGDAKRSQHHHSIAINYRHRYLRTNELDDLNRAIQYCTDGLCLTQEGHKDRPGLLRSLADFHLLRHERSESIVDFETAVQFYHQALDSTPIDDPLRGLRLRSLGAIYTEKYVISKSDADFDAATQYLETSLGNQFHDQRSVSSTLSAFYDCYMRKYQVTKALEDLNAAIHFWEQMFHHSSQYPYTNSVSEATGPAYALWIRYYRHMGEEVDRQAAINNFRLVLDSDRASVRDKRLAGELLLFAHAKDGEWTSAYQTARKTVHLLSSLAHHALDNHDKQYFLADEMSPLASDAAALAIMAGEDVYEAIELLELGRGVIMNALNARRLDLSSLREECPSLAQEFVTLRDQLYALHQSPLENIDQRHEISNKFEQSISNIRKLKGFEHFLRPHSKSDMHAFAQRGPVVIVNASSYRCDAFIIDQASMYTVPLPQLRLSGIKERITKLQHLNSDLLEWLWDTIAIHVLNKLGFSQKPQDDDMPRIWWVLTGPLSKFPIHAAGYHKQNSAQTVLDKVISSYGSSFAMLIYGGDQVDKPQETGKAVIVGTKDLFYVTEEIEKVTDICSSMKLGIVRPLPRRKDIQSAMDNCTIFHFAGHGRVNNLNPLKSHLVLEGDSLTLDDVLESNLSSHPPFLAYLSACGTGQIGKDELVDEGLHLISAFHAGGFQNVIGTLWVVDDRICMDVATETYKWIAQNQMRSRSVSEGLHRTVKNLRDRWILANTEDRGDTLKGTGRAQKVSLKSRDMIPVEADSPLLWVPFVHYGV